MTYEVFGVYIRRDDMLYAMNCPRSALFAFFCVPQADALQKQLDRKVEEFKTKELDRDAQKKELTLVVERLLRKVNNAYVGAIDGLT